MNDLEALLQKVRRIESSESKAWKEWSGKQRVMKVKEIPEARISFQAGFDLASNPLLDELEKAEKKIAILEEANKNLRIGRGIAYLVVGEPPVRLCTECNNPAEEQMELCADCLRRALEDG